MDSAQFARMVQQHIEALRQSGVVAVPRAVGMNRAAQAEPAAAAPQPQPAAVPDLFTPPPSPRMELNQLATSAKRHALDVLNTAQIRGCTRCSELARTRTQTVFGVGNIDAELCFVGEAPGADEDRLGEPFVGAAGQLLDKIIVACKLQRSDVYICNVLKCRPPGNRVPTPEETANCRPFLEEQLTILRPKFICALGATAARWLTNSPDSVAIGKLRGRFHSWNGIPVLCTYHPSYLLRNPAAKKDVWEDMKVLMARMGRPVT